MRIVRAVLIAWFVIIFVPRAFGQAKIAAQPVRAVRFGKLWDGHGKVWTGAIVIVEDGKIRNVITDASAIPQGAEVINLSNYTGLPGLIDVHVHVIAAAVNLRANEQIPNSLIPLHAVPVLRGMLDRGFTTVRDTGGANWGIKTAIETGHITGPRLYIAGQSIGPTGGHSDSRRRTNRGGECVCCNGRNSSPPSPMALTKSGNPRASRCDRAQTM